MNCSMAAWVYSDESAAGVALHQVEAWMRRVEAELSRFQPQSDLSHLNAVAGAAYRAGDILWQVTDLALATAKATGGRFDPTLGQALCAAGYDRSFDLLAPDEAAAAPSPHRPDAWQDILLDAATHTITLPPDVALDLGGIAKGAFVDSVEDLFADFPGAIVDAGGDLRVWGQPGNEVIWRIGVQHPGVLDADIAELQLWAGRPLAVATSSTRSRTWLA